jgi:hypothetical protein
MSRYPWRLRVLHVCYPSSKYIEEYGFEEESRNVEEKTSDGRNLGFRGIDRGFVRSLRSVQATSIFLIHLAPFQSTNITV